MSPLFLSFTFATCDLFTPSFCLCSLCVSCMEKNKKTKKKTGPQKKKKVFDEGWRKTLAETVSAYRISPGTIIDISSSLRPFPSPHFRSTLASRLRVKISPSNLQSRKTQSDIELQACDGNLHAWIMVYINSPSTYPSDRISASLPRRRS